MFTSDTASGSTALLIYLGLVTYGDVSILNSFFCNNVEMTNILQYLTVKYVDSFTKRQLDIITKKVRLVWLLWWYLLLISIVQFYVHIYGEPTG